MFERRPDDMTPGTIPSMTFQPPSTNGDLLPISTPDAYTPVTRSHFPDVHIPLVPKESEVSFTGEQSKTVFMIGKPEILKKESSDSFDECHQSTRRMENAYDTE